MDDLVLAYRDFYEEGAGDEPLDDGRTAHIIDNDWANRPSRSGSALFFVFDSRYSLLEPDLAAQEWISRTRDTWGLLSQWKLCDDCRASGIGATRKDHLHQLSTAFPPFQVLKPDDDCDLCCLLRRMSPAFIQEKVAERPQRISHSDKLHFDTTWELGMFMPGLRSPTSLALSILVAPLGGEQRVVWDADDKPRVMLEVFSVYFSFEQGEQGNPSVLVLSSQGQKARRIRTNLPSTISLWNQSRLSRP